VGEVDIDNYRNLN